MKHNKVAYVVVLVLFSHCKDVPDIQHFDPLQWKNDVNGCDGKRLALSIELESQRQKLKGAAESDLVHLLGHPNEIQVLERQQKYYIYWVQHPVSCKNSRLEYKELRIRLSAIGRVTEALFN